jgi:D-glycero-alpha-D-manno-heptose-7-phosphate kinase
MAPIMPESAPPGPGMMSIMGDAAPSRVVDDAAPSRVVTATAPVRICDIGGWTDTWFAGHGNVFNMAVTPCVRVRIRTHAVGALEDRVVIDAENYGERYGFAPGAAPDRHRLLEAAVEEIGVPPDVSIHVSVVSEVPAGCSLGTSAATTVALLGALDALTPGRMAPHDVAMVAHRVEVERLRAQSGVQDQLCAALGGINYIEMPSYPHASVSPVRPSASTWQALGRCIAVVFLGHAHRSSEVHDEVIAAVTAGRGDTEHCLDELRRAATDARDAVMADDLAGLGRAMERNTVAQRRLHPDLVSSQAQSVIDTAIAAGALGAKVNGAGGDGGSVTLLCQRDGPGRGALLSAVMALDPRFEILPTTLSSHGLRVWSI